MIPPEELSVGHLVILNNPKYRPNDLGRICKVIGIDYKPYKYGYNLGWSDYVANLQPIDNNPFGDAFGQYLNFIKPIPLTKDILENWCGFIMSMHLNCWSPDERLNLKVEDDKISYWESVSADGEFIELDEIKYLHQLQNLCAFKKIPLNINIPECDYVHSPTPIFKDTWISVADSLPLCYMTSFDWDGKKSDPILVELTDGEYVVAECYEGFIDGESFFDWYIKSSGNQIPDSKIYGWMKIPI